jgi:uncharacterized protein (DUF488 family)
MNTIYTIGYEGTQIDRFIAALLAAGVEVLADVRAVPLSRKRGFSKTALREHLAKQGIEYIHFKALGDPNAGREAARQGRYGEFRRVYLRHLRIKQARSDVAELAGIAAQSTTCLMCFERDPIQCHRSMITAKLAGTSAVRHLYADSNVDPTFVPRGNTGQSPSAAEQTLW